MMSELRWFMETVELCEFCIDLCHVKWPYFSYIIILAHQLFDNVDICDNVKILFIAVCLH